MNGFLTVVCIFGDFRLSKTSQSFKFTKHELTVNFLYLHLFSFSRLNVCNSSRWQFGVSPKNPTKVTRYPCLLRDRAWYCIRGLRPMSPSTRTQTRRSEAASRCRSLRQHIDRIPAAAARQTPGQVTPQSAAKHQTKTAKTAGTTESSATVDPYGAMFTWVRKCVKGAGLEI